MASFSASGIRISGTSYLGEFFDNSHRSKYLTLFVTFTAMSQLISPLLGAAILTQSFSFVWFSGFAYRPWRLFIFANSLVAGLTSVVLFFLPEGPTFSMAIGRHQNALETLQTIYRVNTGRPKKVHTHIYMHFIKIMNKFKSYRNTV